MTSPEVPKCLNQGEVVPAAGLADRARPDERQRAGRPDTPKNSAGRWLRERLG